VKEATPFCPGSCSTFLSSLFLLFKKAYSSLPLLCCVEDIPPPTTFSPSFLPTHSGPPFCVHFAKSPLSLFHQNFFLLDFFGNPPRGADFALCPFGTRHCCAPLKNLIRACSSTLTCSSPRHQAPPRSRTIAVFFLFKRAGSLSLGPPNPIPFFQSYICSAFDIVEDSRRPLLCAGPCEEHLPF